MRYQFLEFRTDTDGTEYALLFDSERGVVIVALVEAFEQKKERHIPKPVRKVTQDVNQGEFTGEIPVKPVYNVPPAFRQVMNPPGPGEAVETRIV